LEPPNRHPDGTVVISLHCGKAEDVLATMPDGFAQCVVTSPPYFGLRDYGVDGQLGLEATPAEYVENLVRVFVQVRRVLADDGVLWLNLGDSYLAKNLLGIPWRVAFALQDDGWLLRNDNIWSKPNAMPESVTDRLSTRHEYVFMLVKSPGYYFDLDAVREPSQVRTGRSAGFGRNTKSAILPGRTDSQHRENRGGQGYHPKGKNPGDVWTISTQPFPGAHFATFPPRLVQRCILAGSKVGNTVLDCFAGSGTTVAVADKLGRHGVGIDLNQDYLDLASTRDVKLDHFPTCQYIECGEWLPVTARSDSRYCSSRCRVAAHRLRVAS
jgi:DNA modification methylase